MGAGIDTPTIESLSDETIDRLARELGVGDDDEPKGDEPKTESIPVGGLAEGDEKPASSEGEAPKVTGKALLDSLQSDPEAQALLKRQLDGWLSNAAATAAAEKEQEEFQELIKANNFEEIGRRYVTSASERSIRSAERERAEADAYGQIYTQLFKQPELLEANLTADDKLAVSPDKYATDAEYVDALTNFIAEKRAGVSVNSKVDGLLAEKIETLKNMKTQETVGTPSPSTLPGGQSHTPGSEKMTSSQLLSEGFREMIESEAGERVLET